MIGVAVLTGSANNETSVVVVSIGKGLHFYGVSPNGTSTMTTLFGAALSTSGHYNAVMAYHEANIGPNESAQFYGTCDTHQ